MDFIKSVLGVEKSEFNKDVHMAPPKPKVVVFNLLVIDADYKTNWANLLKDQNFTFNVNGETREIKLVVYQGGWGDITGTSYSRGYSKRKTVTQLDLKINNRGGNGKEIRLFQTVSFAVDFVLVRNQVVGVTPDQNFSRVLYALKYANVPSINSIYSIYNFIERPWVFSELNRLRDNLGDEVFPLIEQNYYSSHRDMLITPSYPIVVKVGHAHAGYGKVKLEHHHDFEDFAGVIALTEKYVTAEPFLIGEYDLRIQKIGNHYRAMKRIGMAGRWKTNTGAALMEEIELTEQYKTWVDECSTFFGGLDICAVDAIHCEDGKEYILEVNDTSIGLHPDHEDEDNQHICDLLLVRMEDYIQNHLHYYF